MCRNCALPEWGEPLKIPVAELPEFFSKQISWNFERLNYGGGAVMETVSGRPERPSVTGRLGCRLREGMQPPTRGKRTERYLLVSECLYCPGKRYGCTPRANCTGKRRNCYAMCKVTVYADSPDIAEVSFSGSHGSGNVTDPSLHRNPHDSKRRRLVDEEGNANDHSQRWKQNDRPTMVESLSSDGLTLDRSSTEVVALEVGQNIMLTGNNVDVINAHRSSSSPEIVIWTTTASGLQPGSSSSWVNSNGTTTSSPTTPSTPLNTPLSATGVTPSPFTPSSSRGAQAKVPSFSTPPPVAPSAAKSSSGHPSWSPPWRAESKFSGSKMRVNQQHQHSGKNTEILTLRQHIQILQQEHLSKISRIAELEAQLQSLKEGELYRLEHQVQRLETENLRKDVKILQLEKQLQTALYSRTQPSPTPVTVLVQQQVSDTVPSHASKPNDVEASHIEEGEKEDEEMEGNKDQDIDKEDDNGDDDSQSVDEA